jgi:aspartate 1-decarboxylase
VYIFLLKSKIHRARVTDSNVDYEGSLAVSAELAEAVGIEEFERVLIANMRTGEQFETYVIYGARGEGIVQLNGATAHFGKAGDHLTVISFALYDSAEAKTHQPKVIILDEKNRVSRQK